MKCTYLSLCIATLAWFCTTLPAEEPLKVSADALNGQGEGWRDLAFEEFENANCFPDTWSWKDGVLHCTGKPTGVLKSKKQITNFELVADWRHLNPAGNSGIFVWTTEASLSKLKPGQLPQGIEVQVLDLGYKTNYEKGGKKAEWFTCHGDVFPVGVKMRPFPPTSPNGQRSFPKKELVKGSPEWNHYYVYANNGEVRLFVNGEEVSGGDNIEPKTGFLCFESEGSPIEFKNLRIRELK